MRKALIIIITVVLVLALGTIAAAVGYLSSDDYKSAKYPDGVTINGVDCSNLTYKEAAEKITDKWNNRKLIVTGALGEELAVFENFGCKYDIQKQLSTVKRDNIIPAALNHYLHIPFSATIGMRVSDTDKAFRKQVKRAEFLVGGDVTECQDAYVDLSDPDFNIVPEVYGTKPDTSKFFDDVIRCIETGNMLLSYDKDNYLSVPEVKSDDTDLLEYQEFCKEHFAQKITYKFGKENYTLSPSEIEKMYEDGVEGDINEEGVQKFVKKLAENYNTAGESIHMKSLSGHEFTVNGGSYGWIIDQEGECQQLEDDLKSLKDVEREPVYAQVGDGQYSHKLGDTYIDVDITRQHVWYFENGKKKFETDCVTGCVAQGHDTPTGVYYLNSKGRNITLVGGGKKGSRGYYESFVAYWMPFIGQSIGLHDASWRSSFGGDIYKYSGSHGCVNLPRNNAAKLFDMLKVGTAVVVHK